MLLATTIVDVVSITTAYPVGASPITENNSRSLLAVSWKAN
ncbi:hypothetical protein A2U01_0072223, partial [Trifolium medium]|nr:hypothetical protein [Trifolium medium]